MPKLIDAPAIVTKITRANGKNTATLVISIPGEIAGEIPLGGVRLRLEAAQAGLELNKTPVRGDRG